MLIATPEGVALIRGFVPRAYVADVGELSGRDDTTTAGEDPWAFAAGQAAGTMNVNARMVWVRYRSHATYSRQPRQVRKEATVTGSCVCSESPVPDFIFSTDNCRRLFNL